MSLCVGGVTSGSHKMLFSFVIAVRRLINFIVNFWLVKAAFDNLIKERRQLMLWPEDRLQLLIWRYIVQLINGFQTHIPVDNRLVRRAVVYSSTLTKTPAHNRTLRLRPACQRPACTRFRARAGDWRFCVLRDSDLLVAKWRQWECWRIVPSPVQHCW